MTFVAHNPASRRHDVASHPETARRAEAILDVFASDARVGTFPRLEPDQLLTREEALRVHTPRLWLNLENHERDEHAALDPDTYMVPGSLEAARGTARLGLQAVERCLAQEEPGFVVSRPPGHHATADRSMGFCLLNNVALAAWHALDRGAERVLVFDHDVHHGNGTQDIFYGSPDVLYESFHLWPHYPGSGAAGEVGEGAGRGFTLNAPVPAGTGDPEIRSLLANIFLPVAKAWRPDVVLVSSGFDSLAHDPLGGLALTAPFFGEMMSAFRALTPRVVCFLEGGYQLDEIPKAALAEAQALGHPGRFPDGPTRSTPVEAALRRAVGDVWHL